MTGAPSEPEREYDYFVSYRSADVTWAQWIAWHLTDDHDKVLIQAWHFQTGDNVIAKMHGA